MSTSEKTKKHKKNKTSSLKHFARVLGYVWPLKRYLFLMGLAMVGLAATYSLSIGSILPVLTVIVQPEGIHGWVDRNIVERRIKASVAGYDKLRDTPVPGIEPGTLLLVDLQSDSPLAAAGAKRGDFILAINDQKGTMIDLCAMLAALPSHTEVKLTLRHPNAGTEEVKSQTGKQSKNFAIARYALSKIPGGLRPEDRLHTLKFVLGTLLVIILVGNFCEFVGKYFTEVVCVRASMDLRRHMYCHVLNLPMSRFTQNTSDMMSRFVQDVQHVNRGLTNFFEKAVAEPLKAIGVPCVAMVIQPRVTLIVLLAAPVAMLIFRWVGKKIRKANRRLLQAYGQMLGVLESTLTGMRVVKGYTRENYERKRLFRIDRKLTEQQIKLGFLEALTSPVIELLAFFSAAGVVVWFASQVVHGTLSVSEFLTMILCFGAIFQPVQKLSKVSPKIQQASSGGERLFEVIDSASEYEQDKSALALPLIRQSIEYRDLCFTYPNTTRPALRNINVNVRKGEIVALVGPNGCGKTTMISLLMRFFEPDSGQILIDGQEIAKSKLRSLRSQISLITQETVIFSDTVANNILYGRPKATMAEVLSASERAFADEFIRALPNGYDEIVGEHGATLSGGQRQRIAIARAILRDAPILVFNEATSQIDPESEMKIHKAIDAFVKGRTAFFIAHRYSTISEADRIIVMKDGEINAIGTHPELLESCQLYRRLYETQFRESSEDN